MAKPSLIKVVRISSYFLITSWVVLRKYSIVMWSLYKISVTFGSISFQRHFILFCYSTVKVHDSQTYRNMEMKREHNSFTFDLRTMFLSFQINFSFVRATVACSILDRTSGSAPSSALRYSKKLELPNSTFS